MGIIISIIDFIINVFVNIFMLIVEIIIFPFRLVAWLIAGCCGTRSGYLSNYWGWKYNNRSYFGNRGGVADGPIV